jgi:hypothetical protein
MLEIRHRLLAHLGLAGHYKLILKSRWADTISGAVSDLSWRSQK